LGTGGITKEDASDAVVAIAALQLYADQMDSDNARKVLASMAQEQQNLGSPLVCTAIADSVEEYVPLSAIQTLTGRRYVWNKNDSMGILALGSDYYGFRIYSELVQRDRNGEKTEEMTQPAKYQAGVYIPETYAYDCFGVQVLYLDGTDLACVCDDSILEKAQELLTLFLAAG
jgi:hypothetical protein